jgi:hypothetical protein
MAPIQGHCDEQFADVKTLFQQFVDSGQELGASVAVNLDGTDVVDLWGGLHRRGAHPALAGRHHRQRLLDDQGDDGAERR